MSRYRIFTHKHQNALAMIEFAFIWPLLILIILGAMDIGIVIDTKMILTSAARDGANHITLHPEDANAGYEETILIIQDKANNSGIILSADDISISGCCTKSQPISVTVRKPLNLIICGFFQRNGIISFPIVLSSTVSVKGQ